MDNIHWQPLSHKSIDEIQQRLNESPPNPPAPRDRDWGDLGNKLNLVCSILLLIHIMLFPLAFASTLIWKSLDILLWYKISALLGLLALLSLLPELYAKDIGEGLIFSLMLTSATLVGYSFLQQPLPEPWTRVLVYLMIGLAALFSFWSCLRHPNQREAPLLRMIRLGLSALCWSVAFVISLLLGSGALNTTAFACLSPRYESLGAGLLLILWVALRLFNEHTQQPKL